MCPGIINSEVPLSKREAIPFPQPAQGTREKVQWGPHTGLGCWLHEVGMLAKQDSQICANPSQAGAQKHWDLEKGLGGSG